MLDPLNNIVNRFGKLRRQPLIPFVFDEIKDRVHKGPKPVGQLEFRIIEIHRQCMEYIVNDPEKMAAFSNSEIMEKAGTEGIEVIMWMVMRGALSPNVNVLHKHYHAPISNTGAGVLLLTDAHD